MIEAQRLAKNRDFERVLDAKLNELNELVLSQHPIKDAAVIQETLIQYHALREFGEFVVEKANERTDG